MVGIFSGEMDNAFMYLGADGRLGGRRGCDAGGRCPNIGAFFWDGRGLPLRSGGKDPGLRDCLESIDSVK